MSAVEIAISALRALEPEDLRVLRALEELMTSYEYVPVEAIRRASGLHPRELAYRLGRLHEMGLIRRWIGPYTGYVLRMAGHDLLALHALVKADVLEAFGKPLGVGKEADVYDALTPDGRRVAVKFHRLGRVSFRQTSRLRGYVAEGVWADWYIRSRSAAKREFKALRLAFSAGVSVPETIARNRHVVVMDIIEGVELAEVSELPDPWATLTEILSNVRKAYLGAGIIHADLSEFNVI
ncbi:serine/threonine protein kinase, partial [Candidatus Bathyarchaeota archaeon]